MLNVVFVLFEKTKKSVFLQVAFPATLVVLVDYGAFVYLWLVIVGPIKHSPRRSGEAKITNTGGRWWGAALRACWCLTLPLAMAIATTKMAA